MCRFFKSKPKLFLFLSKFVIVSLKPGGSIFITTLDKSILMWIAGVMLAEYVFKIVPKGTHHWDKLISPIDVQRILDACKGFESLVI